MVQNSAYRYDAMAAVAQLVEPSVVVRVVMGSSPISRPEILNPQSECFGDLVCSEVNGGARKARATKSEKRVNAAFRRPQLGQETLSAFGKRSEPKSLELDAGTLDGFVICKNYRYVNIRMLSNNLILWISFLKIN